MAKYRGVFITKINGRTYCYAKIWNNYKGIYLGAFRNPVFAALAYNKVAKKLLGTKARLNDISQKQITTATNGVGDIINPPPPSQKGEKNNHSKLSNKERKKIKEDFYNGIKVISLTTKYGVTRQAIHYVAKH